MSNLLTKEEKKLVRKEYYVRVAAVAMTLLFFSGVLSVAELLPSFFYSSVAHTIKKSDLEKMTEDERTSEEIASILRRVDVITSFIKDEEVDGPLTTNLIKEVLAARPEGVTISGFVVESKDSSKVLAISGRALQRSSLISFVTELGKQPSFHSTDVPAESLAQAENISFTVRITGDF